MLGFFEGYSAICEYINKFSLPEVFVAINDTIAYGIAKGLKEHGKRIPQDVSIVGFDDLDIPTIDTIGLTTVKIPLKEMAELCINILKEASIKKIIKHYILPTEVIVRESVAIK